MVARWVLRAGRSQDRPQQAELLEALQEFHYFLVGVSIRREASQYFGFHLYHMQPAKLVRFAAVSSTLIGLIGGSILASFWARLCYVRHLSTRTSTG